MSAYSKQSVIIVMFDFDGTLADSVDLHFQTQRTVFRDLFNAGVSQEFWQQNCLGQDHAGILHTFQKHAGIGEQVKPPLFTELCEQEFEKQIDGLIAIPGMKDAAGRLAKHSNIHTGIASSSTRRIVSAGQRALNMDIDSVVGADDLHGRPPKPAPDPYLMLMEQILKRADLQIEQVEQVIIFEDSANGLLSARLAANVLEKKAGLKASVEQIGYNSQGPVLTKAHPAADHFISDARELKNHVNGILDRATPDAHHDHVSGWSFSH